jgi:hypothetical protein
VIDEWMANIAANPHRSVARNRPDRAVDSCFDASGELLYAGNDAWSGILDNRAEGPCASQFELYSTSRIVAGGPISGDVFECALQQVDRAVAAGVYGPVTFTNAELARLQEIFPTGVCDYTRHDTHRCRPGRHGHVLHNGRPCRSSR